MMFTRSTIPGKRRNAVDRRGQVQVRIARGNGRRGHTVSNITRCLTIKDARVSEVFKYLEKVLFEDNR